MDSYHSTWSSFEFELEILYPSSHGPLTRSIYRKVMIWFESYGSPNIDDIGLVIFDLRQEAARENNRGYDIQTESML